MGHLRVVKDFLPPPDKLVLKEDNVKVTISLKKSSIFFFKEQAKTQKTSYQRMIREVVDGYASHYKKSAWIPYLISLATSYEQRAICPPPSLRDSSAGGGQRN